MLSLRKKIKWRYRLVAFAASIVLFVGYFHIYIFVLHLPLPKLQYLRAKNEKLQIEAQMLTRRMDEYNTALDALHLRDEDIYRSIFGLNTIPSSLRDGGLNGATRYQDMEFYDRNGTLRAMCSASDKVLKKAYIQSKSYDEIDVVLQSADQMATSIPAICPLLPDRSTFYLSSGFGNRMHPVLGYRRPHNGMDFSIKPGAPVYVTGDGVVESVKIERTGYGRQVVINHGFGYKTRYAHCKTIIVAEGMKVKRGEQIATTGNSGISSGPHLHYEVIYKGKPVNPSHYFDLDIPIDQYKDIISQAANNSDNLMYVHPSHRK